MINGIINVNKPEGFTSHDVVAKLRGILHFRHIGHTGTLDPMATGVLPVCIGSATKLCDMLTEKTKIYEAVVLFGTATDTEDITGNVVNTLPVLCSEQELIKAFEKFTGNIIQIPPMYSAIKVNGKKLYELARAGKTIEAAGRPVTIHEIKLLSFEEDENGHLTTARIRVTCGKGTYIRSLCRDLGTALNTCACMKELTRLETGRFSIKNAVTLEQIEEAVKNNETDRIILPIDRYFDYLPVIKVLPEFDRLIHNGNPLRKSEILLNEKNSDAYRVYDSANIFCGIYSYNERIHKYSPDKMFLEMKD